MLVVYVATLGAERHVLGRGRVHRRRARARHSASAGHAAVRRAAQRVGAAVLRFSRSPSRRICSRRSARRPPVGLTRVVGRAMRRRRRGSRVRARSARARCRRCGRTRPRRRCTRRRSRSSIATIVAADRRGPHRRAALARAHGVPASRSSVPLHLSALVAAPVAIYLAARARRTARSTGARRIALAGVAVCGASA